MLLVETKQTLNRVIIVVTFGFECLIFFIHWRTQILRFLLLPQFDTILGSTKQCAGELFVIILGTITMYYCLMILLCVTYA